MNEVTVRKLTIISGRRGHRTAVQYDVYITPKDKKSRYIYFAPTFAEDKLKVTFGDHVIFAIDDNDRLYVAKDPQSNGRKQGVRLLKAAESSKNPRCSDRDTLNKYEGNFKHDDTVIKEFNLKFFLLEPVKKPDSQ